MSTQDLSQPEMQIQKQSNKISTSQREAMLQFMQDHPALATGRFNGPEGAKLKSRLLEDMTNILNSCATGASKSGDKWMKSWQDWRSDVKSKAAKLKQHRVGTGGGEQCTVALNSLEERLLAYLGPECVTGHAIVDPLQVQVAGQQSISWILQGAGSSQGSTPTVENAGSSLGHTPVVVNCDQVEYSNEVGSERSTLSLAVVVASPLGGSESTNTHPSSAASCSAPVSVEMPAPSSSSSTSRKRRRTNTENSGLYSETDAPLIKTFDEKNVIEKERLDIEKQRLLRETKRYELELETRAHIERASLSFCNTMESLSEFLRRQK